VPTAQATGYTGIATSALNTTAGSQYGLAYMGITASNGNTLVADALTGTVDIQGQYNGGWGFQLQAGPSGGTFKLTDTGGAPYGVIPGTGFTYAGNNGITSTTINTPASITVHGGLITASSSQPNVGASVSDVTASRSVGTTYTNPSSTKPLFVSVVFSGSGNNNILLKTSGSPPTLIVNEANSDNGNNGSVFGIVTPGDTYSVTLSGVGTSTVVKWIEWQ
jgi:hypothetical protein